MKLYEPISQESIFDEINDICGTTDQSYTNKQKVARVNEALDKYFFLAVQSAPQGTFDDTGNTSIPVETPDLVDGTNAYKLSSITNNILQILRVSVIDSNGEENDLIYEDFEDIKDFTERYSTDSEDRGDPEYWTKVGDYVYIYPCPNYAETSGLRLYVSRELNKFPYVTFTTTFATDLFTTIAAHGLVADDGLVFVTDTTIPGGLTADTTVYYVIASGLTLDDFKVSTTLGGSTITLSSDGTGNQKYVKVSGEPGIPVIHHDYLAQYASYKFMDADHPKFAKIRELLAIYEQEIEEYWQSMIKPGKTIIETNKRVYK